MPAADPIERLVHDAARLTGGELPALLSTAAPTLSPTLAIDGSRDDDAAAPAFYLIGLIGGKDVGKSSLANAIAGVTLTAPTNTGEGTRDAIAYVHADVEHDVRSLLERVVPGRFQIVRHAHESLRSQVLVDLPDIDSKYHDHIDLTRTVLRHLLFPVFVQSVEKYADQRPQRLLAQVAEGNDPANFLFALNKIDQLVARDGEEASLALAADHARRTQALLALPDSPSVFRISAQQPDAFDLPALRAKLARDRDPTLIRRSIELAAQRRQVTLVRWLESQRLEDRLAHADRIVHAARDLAEDKLLAPIDRRVVPRLREETLLRADMIESASRRRIARWPIANVIDVVLAPITSLFRRGGLGSMIGSTTRSSVRGIMADLTPPLDAGVRTLFAELRRRDPSIAETYGTFTPSGPPWSDQASEEAAADLTTRLADTMEARKRRVVDLAGAGHGRATWPVRWLLTLGAVIWFPIAQPLLEIFLDPTSSLTGITLHSAYHVVRLLGAVYLLRSVAFLAIYFTLLWATLRYFTARRVERLIDGLDDAGASLTSIDAEGDAWVNELLAPLESRTAELRKVVEDVETAKRSIRAA